MTTATRTARSAVVRMVEITDDGDTRTSYYGPFMPHAGGAVNRVIDALYAAALGRGSDVSFYVEDVFIGPGESDLETFR